MKRENTKITIEIETEFDKQLESIKETEGYSKTRTINQALKEYFIKEKRIDENEE